MRGTELVVVRFLDAAVPDGDLLAQHVAGPNTMLQGLGCEVRGCTAMPASIAAQICGP